MNNKNHILKALHDLSRRMFPTGKGKVFLYGSRAEGKAGPDSDWDVLIITEDALNSNDNYKKYAFPYAELGWKYGEQITPIHYSESEWAAEANTAFYLNVKKSLVPIL